MLNPILPPQLSLAASPALESIRRDFAPQTATLLHSSPLPLCLGLRGATKIAAAGLSAPGELAVASSVKNNVTHRDALVNGGRHFLRSTRSTKETCFLLLGRAAGLKSERQAARTKSK